MELRVSPQKAMDKCQVHGRTKYFSTNLKTRRSGAVRQEVFEIIDRERFLLLGIFTGTFRWNVI